MLSPALTAVPITPAPFGPAATSERSVLLMWRFFRSIVQCSVRGGNRARISSTPIHRKPRCSLMTGLAFNSLQDLLLRNAWKLMKHNLSWLLVSPEALRRGWLGWILSGAVARTGGLEVVWAGLVDEPAGRAALLVFRGEDAVAKLSAAVGSVRDAGSLAAMLGEGMLSAAEPGANIVADLQKFAAS